MIEDHPVTSVETALRMIRRYAESSGIAGRELAWIFDVGRVATRMLNPKLLGSDCVMIQCVDGCVESSATPNV